MYTVRNVLIVMVLSTFVGAVTFILRRGTRTDTWRTATEAALDRHRRGLSAIDHALADHIRECNPTADELLPMPRPTIPELETDR